MEHGYLLSFKYLQVLHTVKGIVAHESVIWPTSQRLIYLIGISINLYNTLHDKFVIHSDCLILTTIEHNNVRNTKFKEKLTQKYFVSLCKLFEHFFALFYPSDSIMWKGAGFLAQGCCVTCVYSPLQYVALIVATCYISSSISCCTILYIISMTFSATLFWHLCIMYMTVPMRPLRVLAFCIKKSPLGYLLGKNTQSWNVFFVQLRTLYVPFKCKQLLPSGNIWYTIKYTKDVSDKKELVTLFY
jgi:hypothetical protein